MFLPRGGLSRFSDGQTIKFLNGSRRKCLGRMAFICHCLQDGETEPEKARLAYIYMHLVLSEPRSLALLEC